MLATTMGEIGQADRVSLAQTGYHAATMAREECVS